MIRTIYQHPLWAKSQETMEDGIVKTFHFENENGKVDYQYVKRIAGEIDGETYYDILTPRGRSGPCFSEIKSEQIFDDYFKAFKSHCEKEKIIAEFMKFDSFSGNKGYIEKNYDISFSSYFFVIDLRKDFFNLSFNQTKRYGVRKIEREGATIEEAHYEGIDEFLRIYQFMVEKNSAGSFYRIDKKYITNMMDTFGTESVKIVFVKYNNERIATGIFAKNGEIVYYLYGASDPKYSKLNAVSFMLYKEGTIFRKEGYSYLDLGGASVGGGLEKFKRTITNENEVYEGYVGKIIYNKNIYDKLVEINGKHEGFFPEYRSKEQHGKEKDEKVSNYRG